MRRCGSIALVLLAVAALAGVGHAQRSSVPRILAGTWSHDGTPDRAMGIVEHAFTPGLRTLPELFRGFALDRIRNSMVPPSRVQVRLEGSHVHVALTTDHAIVIDGELGEVAHTTGVEGDTRVSSHLHLGWLELRYAGEGNMQQLFSTEQDGSRMHVDYTIESERLPDPVRYRLDFVPAR